MEMMGYASGKARKRRRRLRLGRVVSGSRAA
jgi:hypothetical protein